MLLNDAYKKYYDLLIKGTTEGLNHNDYNEVLSLSKLQFENDLYKKYWVELMQFINYLLEDLKMDSKITSCISPECMEYVKEHCYLFPLVLANRTEKYVQAYQEGSYLFLCPFHEDEYPTLEVKDYKNQYRCVGCGEKGNVFDYISKVDDIPNMNRVIDLLLFTYKLDVFHLPKELFEKAIRYRSMILSDQYKRLLEKGYSLFKANKIFSIEGYFVDKLYEDRFYMIHRLERNETDPYFHYEPNTEYNLKLSLKEYEPFIDKVSKKI